jgi:hypothetical protein
VAPSTAPPIGAGTATAVAPATSMAAGGVAGGNAALAPPVSAGATGNNAGNNESPTAGAGLGSTPNAGGAGDGNPQNAGPEGMVSSNDTFRFDANLATQRGNRNAEVGSMSFLDQTIAFTKRHFEIDRDAQTASLVNFNLPSAENNLFGFSNAKIDSIVFNTADGTLNSITISSGAVSFLAGRGFYYGESMTATLNKGQAEYQVSVANAKVNIAGDAIAINDGYFRLGTDGKFIEAGAPQVKSLFFEAGGIKITPNGVVIDSLTAGVNVFGKSVGVSFSGVSVVDGKVNGTGTLTPMTDLSFMNGKGTFVAPSAAVNVVDNALSGVVTTGISYEGGLFTADEVKAQLSGQEAAISMDRAVLNIMGEPLALADTFIRVGTNGEFLEAGSGLIETSKFKAQGVSVLPDGLRVNQVETVLPPVLGKPLDLKFEALSAVNGNWNATGSITPSGELSYMDDKLKFPDLNAQIGLADNKFSGTITSQIVYEDTSNLVKANGLGTIVVGDTSSFQLTNGTAEAELSGMKFTGQGVTMNATAESQSLSIAHGNVNVPYFNNNFNVDIQNGLIDSQNGFKFDEMRLATGDALEILPNFKVGGTVVVKRDDATQEYSISVVGGIVDYKGGPGGLEIGATVDMNYSETAGLSGSISNSSIKTNFADLTVPGTIALGPDGFTLPSATANVNGIGATPLTATATNIVYNKTDGLSIEKITTTLPKIGETVITAEANNIAIGSSLSVGDVQLAFTTGNQISLAGGKVMLSELAGGASLGADGKWGFNITSNLSTTIPNFEAAGTVNIGYDNTGPTLNVQDGSINTNFNGIDIRATGLGYDISTEKLIVRTAEVSVPEFNGVAVTATADNVSIGSAGFEGSIALVAAGEVELMSGLKITRLEGAYTNLNGASQVSMFSSASIQTNAFSGSVTKVGAQFTDTQKTFSAEGLTLDTPYFSVAVARAQYDSTTSSFSMEQATVRTKGLDSFGNPEAVATGLSYDKDGFKMESFNANLDWEGKANAIMLNGSNINLPAAGAPTGTATLALAQDFSLAGGAIKVGSPTATATLATDGWDLNVSGNVELAAAGGSASGLVSIGYNKAEGLRAGITGGALNAEFASLGLSIAATNISYNHNQKELIVESGTATASRIGSGLTGEISDLHISGSNINFSDLTVRAGGLNFEVVRGVNMSLNSASLTKDGNNFTAQLNGGINIDRATPQVKASTTGSLTYDITRNRVSGRVNRFELETSIFKTQVNNVDFTREGFSIASAELGLLPTVNVGSMQQYIPGFQPWMLDIVRGVKFVAQDISYSARTGLQIGRFYPDIPPVRFSLMDGALTGELDLRNQRGSLSGQKNFNLPQIETPSFRLPIVPGVSAEINARVAASMNMRARINLSKESNYWDLSGSLSLGANLNASVYGGALIDAYVASAGAGIRVAANLSAEGTATLAGGIRYNPESRRVEMATPLRFNYNMMADLAARLQLELSADILGREVYSKAINLAQWQIGRVALSGAAEAPDFGSLWGNLRNRANVTALGRTVFQR